MAATIELGKGLLIFSPTTPAQIVIRRVLRRVGCATPALPVPVANGEPGTGVNGPATDRINRASSLEPRRHGSFPSGITKDTAEVRKFTAASRQRRRNCEPGLAISIATRGRVRG